MTNPGIHVKDLEFIITSVIAKVDVDQTPVASPCRELGVNAWIRSFGSHTPSDVIPAPGGYWRSFLAVPPK